LTEEEKKKWWQKPESAEALAAAAPPPVPHFGAASTALHWISFAADAAAAAGTAAYLDGLGLFHRRVPGVELADLLLPADVAAAWEGRGCLAETAAVAVAGRKGGRALGATNFLLGFETFIKPPPPVPSTSASVTGAVSSVGATGDVPLRSAAESRLSVAGSLLTADSAVRLRSLFAAATAGQKNSDEEKADVVLLSGLCGRGKGHNNFTDLQLTLSHLAAIRRAVHANVTSSRYALIAEDDVTFPFDVDWRALAASAAAFAAPQRFGFVQLFELDQAQQRRHYVRFRRNNSDLWSVHNSDKVYDSWAVKAYLIDREVLRPVIDKIYR
jgi:hypothetical protein